MTRSLELHQLVKAPSYTHGRSCSLHNMTTKLYTLCCYGDPVASFTAPGTVCSNAYVLHAFVSSRDS